MKKVFSLLWRGWKKFAHVLGIINTRILLTISYFLVMAGASLVTTIARKDLLDRRMTKTASYYHPHEPVQATLENVRRQF